MKVNIFGSKGVPTKAAGLSKYVKITILTSLLSTVAQHFAGFLYCPAANLSNGGFTEIIPCQGDVRF